MEKLGESYGAIPVSVDMLELRGAKDWIEATGEGSMSPVLPEM